MKRESAIAVRHHLVTLHPVGTDATDVRHEDTRLAWNIRAQPPGIRFHEQRLAGRLVDMIDPGVLCLDRRFDCLEVSLDHVVKTRRDPIDVLLNRHYHLAQHRWATRTRYREQIREAGDLETEIAAWPSGPFRLQTLPSPAADVDV